MHIRLVLDVDVLVRLATVSAESHELTIRRDRRLREIDFRRCGGLGVLGFVDDAFVCDFECYVLFGNRIHDYNIREIILQCCLGA